MKKKTILQDKVISIQNQQDKISISSNLIGDLSECELVDRDYFMTIDVVESHAPRPRCFLREITFELTECIGKGV